ncbi:hypothetical protein LP414_19570 [Polaromonas sp. P1(28)-13]|nr:hypothetical protein LP414_19570 [Polaromonas sp. P1(28)-13]
MFIRYFSHGSAFSVNRKQIEDKELATVGLYFRPDTGFCSLMTAQWLGEREAKLAFSHYVALNLLMEACLALRSITAADFREGPVDLSGFKISPALVAQLGSEVRDADGLFELVDAKLAELEIWVRNPKRAAPRRLFPLPRSSRALPSAWHHLPLGFRDSPFEHLSMSSRTFRSRTAR